MTDEIALIGEGDGVVVAGERSTVERFLDRAGLLSVAEEFDLVKLSTVLESGAAVAERASTVSELSGRYLKLTPESAQRLKDAGGLMKTKSKGISHAMLGAPGKESLKWLQVEDGPMSFLTSPVVLSGIGGLMSQFAQQAEARELKALLLRLDEKLDDIRRTQRDAVLAKLKRAEGAIEEAMTIHRHGGDPQTLWDKVNGEHATILEVQQSALDTLGALADKVEGKRRAGELKKAAREIERDVALQLSVVARCFALHDEFRIIELEHVQAANPKRFDRHRAGIAEAREARRAGVLERTSRLIKQMTAAGGIANENILLHKKAAGATIAALSSTKASIDDFHSPLGIEARHDQLSVTPWFVAFGDPRQRKNAATEAGQKAAMTVGAAALLTAGAKNLSNKKS